MEQLILGFIQNVYQTISWPGVVLLMAIESACIPLPSELIMPLAGWYLIQEPGLPATYNLLAGFYGAVGCTIGSAVAYAVGYWGGRPLVIRYGRFVLVTRHDLEMAEGWFRRHGDATAFFSRLLPVVRTFISLPAGVARTPFLKFLVYSFLGSLPWSFGLSYGGYLLGENYEKIRTYMRPFDIPIIIVVLAGAAYFFWHRWRNRVSLAEGGQEVRKKAKE